MRRRSRRDPGADTIKTTREGDAVVICLDVNRLQPNEIFVPKFSRLSTEDALIEVHYLVGKCFWPLDVRYAKVIAFVDQLRWSEGAQAARLFLQLDNECKFFVRFALEIYGLKLVVYKFKSLRQILNWPKCK